jgi:hypothetical protein
VIETNGAVDTGVAYQLDHLSYGDLRKLRKIDAGGHVDLDTFDEILDRAIVGGVDAILITEMRDVMRGLMRAINEAMSGSGLSPAPSSQAYDAGEPTATPI